MKNVKADGYLGKISIPPSMYPDKELRIRLQSARRLLTSPVARGFYPIGSQEEDVEKAFTDVITDLALLARHCGLDEAKFLRQAFENSRKVQLE